MDSKANGQGPVSETMADATMSMVRANVLSLPIFAVALALYLVPYLLIWGKSSLEKALIIAFAPYLFLPVLILVTVVHEALHGLGFVLFGGVAWRAVRFGVRWRVLTPYAHCRSPLKIKAYRRSVMLPGLMTGIAPATVGLGVGLGWLTIWGAVFLGAAGGDLLVLWAIRSVPADARVLDHPERVGCEVLAE